MKPRLVTPRVLRHLVPVIAFAGLISCTENPAAPSNPTSPNAPAPPGPAPTPTPTPPGPSPVSLAVTPVDALLEPGQAVQLQAVLTYDDGTEAPADGVTWLSDDDGIATAASDGTVQAVEGGVVSVVAQHGSLADTVRIAVRLYLAHISVGDMHTCGITLSGAARCWGGNAHGELGMGDYDMRFRPAPAAEGFEFSALTAAGGFTCGVTTTGQGYCWGDDSMMELGESQTGKSTPNPVAIAGNLDLRITSGSQMAHACGLETDGTAWCWGYNRFGMVGHGILRDEPEPVPVAGGHVFADLHSSYMRTCGVDDGGDVYCWGRGGAAQVGDPAAVMESCDARDCATSPMRAAGSDVYASVSVGRAHTCALTTGGDVHCWGANESGQLGVGGYSDVSVPTAVALPGSARQVVTGRAHSCALLADGSVHCWGDNAQGQLGTADWAASDVPRAIGSAIAFDYLAAGYHQTCALTAGGEAHCWGRNAEHQLGVGSDDAYPQPMLIQFE